MRFISTHSKSYSHYPIGENFNTNKKVAIYIASLIQKNFPTQEINFFVRGSSGSIIASILGMLISNAVTIFYISKESSHRCPLIKSHLIKPDQINIIVDDFIATGNTVKVIFEDMKQAKVKVNALAFLSTLDLQDMKTLKIIFNNQKNLIVLHNG